MHTHECVRCSICDRVIRQCRCIEGGRNVRFEVCGTCAQHPAVKAELEGKVLPAKPERETVEASTVPPGKLVETLERGAIVTFNGGLRIPGLNEP